MHQLLFDYISKYMPLTDDEKKAILDLDEEVFAKFPRFETLCRIVSEDLLVKSQS